MENNLRLKLIAMSTTMTIKMLASLPSQMKNIFTWIGVATATLSFLTTPGKQAVAGTLYKGWNYAIDSFNDGVSGGQVGGGIFEFYGMAIKQEADSIFVAFNANLPLVGDPQAGVENGSISWGDLFFNFSGEDFYTASTKGNLWGIRFAQSNDSGASTLGVYTKVKAKNVTQTNSGFDSLQQYNMTVEQYSGTPSVGDLAANDPYFIQPESVLVLNEIATGTKVGEITLLSSAELTGLDFGYFQAIGSQTFGFSFSKSLLPKGNYIANVFAECINDGMALKGAIPDEPQSVPEPTSILSLIALGAVSVGSQRWRKEKTKVVS